MSAFGINAQEMRTMCTDNPARLLGISVLESVTSA
jgi:predicted metal-dependent phosphotriesterase family hydrolase